MRQATFPRPMRRIVAAMLLAALCAPAPVLAADESTESPAVAEDTEGEPPPPAVEKRWYDEPLHQFDIVFDLIVIRPLAGVTAACGAALFVPAAILTAPNGKDSLKEAYERFVREPGEYFAVRPLGEF